MTETKREHFVPKAYLDRFARDGRVFERCRDGKSFISSTINVAVECGFYDIENPDSPNPKSIEEFFSNIEGHAAELFRLIDDRMKPPAPNTAERSLMSAYLAIQMTRTPEQRERLLFHDGLNTYLDGRELSMEVVEEYLRDEYLGFQPMPAEVKGAFVFARILRQREDADGVRFGRDGTMIMMLQSVQKLAPVLGQMHWCLEIDRKEHLITSDTPLMLWREPSPRDRFRGVGIATADEVRFPLDPGKQLVLTKKARTETSRISPQRSMRCNQDMAFGCNQFIVGSPNEQTRMNGLDIPRKKPLARFSYGPLAKENADGSVTDDGEVLHFWVPRR